jgi:hypothetical protein
MGSRTDSCACTAACKARDAVTSATPGARVGNTILIADSPAATGQLAGTSTTPGLLFVRVIVIALSDGADSTIIAEVMPPTFTGFGENLNPAIVGGQ